MPFVEVELAPRESAVAVAGALICKDAAIEMRSGFGDDCGQHARPFGSPAGAGPRVVSGEEVSIAVFTHAGTGEARLAFAAPCPGTIVPVELSEIGGRLICHRDAFLAAIGGVAIGDEVAPATPSGSDSGFMPTLAGDGWVFLHGGGTLLARQLAAGETLDVNVRCLAAFTAGMRQDVSVAGTDPALAMLTGPGHVWLQSLPFSRSSARLSATRPRRGGADGDGSILGRASGIGGGRIW